MKKVAAAITAISFLTLTSIAMAQSPGTGVVPPAGGNQRNVQVAFPGLGVNPGSTIGTIISNALKAIFIVGALAVLLMLVWGAFQWITSGGEKESIGKARGRIIAALVGLAILALAFLITVVVGQVVNINLLNLPALPRLDQAPGANSVNPQ